jgi:hypothetical protein
VRKKQLLSKKYEVTKKKETGEFAGELTWLLSCVTASVIDFCSRCSLAAQITAVVAMRRYGIAIVAAIGTVQSNDQSYPCAPAIAGERSRLRFSFVRA